MINLKTLKIGNYVQCSTMILQVVSIDRNGILGAYFVEGQKHGDIQITDSSEIEGIQLSSLLLSFLGFNELKNDHQESGIFINARSVAIIQKPNGNFQFRDDVKGTYDSESDLEFKYVHQLQNKYIKKTQEPLLLPGTPDQYEKYL